MIRRGPASPENNNASFIVTFVDCDHWMSYFSPVPRKRDIVYCKRCASYRVVKETVGEWRVACKAARCPVSRGFGTDEKAARQFADKHLDRFNTHVILLNQGHKEVCWLRYVQPALVPKPAYVPKLTQWNRQHPNHQASLRDIYRGEWSG
jgi:hypothetical protein